MNKKEFVLTTLKELLVNKDAKNLYINEHNNCECMCGEFIVKSTLYSIEIHDNKLSLYCSLINDKDCFDKFVKFVIDDVTNAEICDLKVEFYSALERFENKCIELFNLNNAGQCSVGTVPTDARIQQDKTTLDSMDSLV